MKLNQLATTKLETKINFEKESIKGLIDKLSDEKLKHLGKHADLRNIAYFEYDKIARYRDQELALGNQQYQKNLQKHNVD